MHNLSRFHKIRDRDCTSALSFKVASLFVVARDASLGKREVATSDTRTCAQILREERLSGLAKTLILKVTMKKI